MSQELVKSSKGSGLPESDKESLLKKVLGKYQQDDLINILESLLLDDVPLTGFAEKLDKEYFIRRFLQISHRARNDFHSTIALEKAARLCGHWERADRQESPNVNISIVEHEPAGYRYTETEEAKAQ